MLVFGQVCLYLAFASSILAVGSFFWGRSQGPKAGKDSTTLGYYATWAALALYSVCVVILAIAFFTKDFSFSYVAQYYSYNVSNLAWLYKLSGVWAGQSGSLLFWGWLIAVFNGWIAYRRFKISDDLSNVALAVSNAILVVFGISMIFFPEINSPFAALHPSYLDETGNLISALSSWGLNQQLEHWAMVLHPPTLFIGYAGFTIPFAYAVAAMIVNDGSKLWAQIVSRITILAWLFMGIGIGLGAVWAYVDLNFGGYWAWDPVENASLLPWLMGVGLIHSLTIYRRHGGFKKWAVINASVTFSTVVFGTFLTRSGVITNSAHIFGGDGSIPAETVPFLFLALIPFVAIVWGLNARKETFNSDDQIDSLSSKNAAYYFNNVIMIVATGIIAYFTLASALPSWMPFGGMSIGVPTYDSIARPIGILYIAIVAVCPLLVWGKRAGKEFWSRIKVPGLAALVVFIGLVAFYAMFMYPNYVAKNGPEVTAQFIYHNGLALIGLFVAALTFCTSLFLFIEGARRRSKGTGESIGKSLMFIVFRARQQAGGYLSHLGMAIILVGLIGASMFVVGNPNQFGQIELVPGATLDKSGHVLTFVGYTETPLSNGNTVFEAVFDVAKDGKNIGRVQPSLEYYARSESLKPHISVLSRPVGDLWVNPSQVDDKGIMTVSVMAFPAMVWMWIGFGVLSLGTVLAVWPSRKPEPMPDARVIARAKAAAKR